MSNQILDQPTSNIKLWWMIIRHGITLRTESFTILRKMKSSTNVSIWSKIFNDEFNLKLTLTMKVHHLFPNIILYNKDLHSQWMTCISFEPQWSTHFLYIDKKIKFINNGTIPWIAQNVHKWRKRLCIVHSISHCLLMTQ